MKYYPANLTVLSAEFVSTPTHVSITPDGRWIAVISDSRLYLFERDGDGYIERTGFSFGGSTQTIVCASFSPDGQTLALAYTGGVRLRYVKLDGSGNIVDSLNNASASGQGTCQLIVWSHDSSRLAFHHNGLSGKRLSFYDRDANGDLSHFANASTSAPYGAVGGAFNGGKNAYVSTYGETGDSHHYVLVGNTYSYRTTFNSGAIGVEYLGGDVMMFHFANSDPLLMEIPGYNRVAIPVTWPTLPPRPAYVATVRYGDGTARVFFVDQSSPGVLTPRSFVFDVDGTDTTILGGQEDHQFILPSGVSIEGPPKISDDIETMVFGASGASLLAIGTPNGNAAEITFPIFGAAAELQLDTSPRDGTASLGLTLLETDSFLGTGEHAEPIVAPNVVDPIPIASNGLAPQFNLVDPDFEYGYGISAFPAFAADGHVRPVHQVSGNLLYPTFNIQGEIDNPIAVFSDASYPNFNFKGELDVTIVAIQEGKLSFPAFETHGQAASPYTADSADLMLPQMEASGELVAPTWTASELMLPKLTSDGNVTMPIGVVGSEFFPPLTFQGDGDVDNSPRGAVGSIPLPMFSANGGIYVAKWGIVSATLPPLGVDGFAEMPGYVIGDPLFPRFSSDGLGAPDYTLDVAANFPRMRVGGWAGPPYVINANTFFPRPIISADAKFGYRLEANASFPAFRLRAYDSESLTVPTADFGSFVSSLSVGGSGVTFSMTATFKIG